MRSHRPGFHIRLNQEQQRMVNMMCDFYDKDPKQVTYLALQQLYIATGEVAKKLAAQQQVTQEEVCDTGSSDSESSSQDANQNPS
jgi:hypothetical protein